MNNTTRTKVLVIDDDIEIQELMIAFFKPKGFQVSVYDDAQKALDELSTGKALCDVIICDLQLPSISGIEFTKKLKGLGLDIPIIMITANKAIEIAIQAVETGAYDFVLKPIPFPQLLVSVERALHFNKIKSDNNALRTAFQLKDGILGEEIIGKSPGFKKVMDLAKRVAGSQANIFINGESGTGKEVVAKAIHNMGSRKNKEFVALNCASIPENLLESELFGHTKGAFTGAIEKKMGLFEEAEGGTLFLDEIGDLSFPLQAKILRVLQERQIKRIGENKYRKVDVRILSATHRDLRKEVAEGKFREDLFYRLNVIEIKIPPLRERTEDILPLADFFMKKFSALNNVNVKGFSKTALEEMHSYSWPGNVRELENAIERAVVMCTSGVIQLDDLPERASHRLPSTDNATGFNFSNVNTGRTLTIDEVVQRYIKYVLDKNDGVKEKTALDLNIDRKTLYRKLKEIEIHAN